MMFFWRSNFNQEDFTMGLGNIGKFIDENWHGGQIKGDFYSHPEMTIEETVRVDKKPSTLVWNWRHALTRELMRGRHKSEILAKYRDAIDRFGIRVKVEEFLDRNDGFLGWFVVDVANFDDKFGYEDMPEELRRCNLYAYNAIELREIISRSLTSENDGTMDGFLGADDSVHEEVRYVDDYTGLPCIDDIEGIFDNDDARLAGIADYFLGRNWMTIGERNAFVNSGNKLAYLVSILRRSFAPKSKSDGKFDDIVGDYGVKQQELEADASDAVKDVEIGNVHENALGDLGKDVVMPEKYDIVKENSKSDFRQDVQVGTPVTVFEIKKEFKPSDFRSDVEFDDIVKDRNLDGLAITRDSEFGDIDVEEKPESLGGIAVTRESDLSEVDTGDSIDYGLFDDNMTELTDKDYRDDVKFDNVEDFVIDDIKDMKDDEFDYADLSKGDVDVDEMFDLDADRNEADVDEVPEEVEISNRYDWSW